MTAFRAARDAVTFLAGLAMVAYEVYTAGDGEPSLVVLGLGATMMGLPGTLGFDRLLNRDPGPEAPAGPTAVPDPPQSPPSHRRAR